MPGMDRGGRHLAPLAVWSLMGAVAPASAEAPSFRLPIDCTLGRDCYIQQYVDRDPGPGARDVGCGTLANDGHRGTDFALPSRAAMEAGVAVLAAAPGVVRGLRDGMPDIAADDPAAPDMEGRECGNGVVIAHGEGWESQYCHLREGSVAVQAGDRVEAGDTLGLVGMSGQATFPHVHFGVRENGAVVDPFRPDDGAACGVDGAGSLWRSPPEYRAAGLVSVGMAADVPTYEAVQAGLPEDGIADRTAPVVLWAYVFGGRTGDTITLEIDGPGGGAVGEHTAVLDKDQPLLFRAWGRRAPSAGWPSGDYAATVTLRRDGLVLDTGRAVAALP